MKNKHLTLGIISLLGTAAISAQDINPTDLPTVLKTTFQQNYANAVDVEWERRGADFEVEFDLNNVEHEIWYNSNGKAIKIEKDITKNELPQAIKAALSSNYKAYTLDSIEMKEENDSIVYEIELEKGWDEKHVVFNNEGKILGEWKD